MKREAKQLLSKSLQSLLLSVEHFNRPWNEGRHEAVLILLDRGIELLLKSAIIHQGGKIREHGAQHTIGFDACVRKCSTDANVKCLTDDQVTTLRIINAMRDAAQHYLVGLSEQQLYLYAQAGVTVFDDILETVFGQSLSERLPERVLPISSSPPTDFHALVHAEFEDIRKLVEPGKRRHSEALLRLRSLAIVEGCIWGHTLQPAESDLRKLIKRIRKGTPWQDIFPGVASIKLDTEGTGLNVTVRISKHEGEPVRLVKAEDAPDAPIIAVKRVDELGFYSLSFTQLRQKLELSQPKMSAVIWHLGAERNDNYFKTFKIGKSVFKRYSQRALDHIRKELPALDLDKVWDAYKGR